ncbi:MAG: DUF2752 domain-containing protein [Phycisphaerales bacterium]
MSRAVAVVPTRSAPTLAPRLVSLVVFVGSGVLLGLSAWLSPSPAGHGTHTQLGLFSCAWPILFGHPCPTCGMTTAFAHAADGHLVRAFAAQPFGLLLALGVAGAFWVSLYVAATGSGVWRVFGVLVRPRVLWLLLALALAAWGYKWLTWPAGSGAMLGTVPAPSPNSTR